LPTRRNKLHWFKAVLSHSLDGLKLNFRKRGGDSIIDRTSFFFLGE